MLTRFLWRLLAPYVAAAVTQSLLIFYQQLVASQPLQNVPAPQPDPHEPVTVSGTTRIH